jgi:hypothetical protein
LEIEPEGSDYLVARIRSAKVSAEVRVWLHEDAQTLSALFDAMAAEWRGWSYEKTWASIEGELALKATIDRAGHVEIRLRMQDVLCANPWSLATSIKTEAGQLEAIAKQARRVLARRS